jgi:hypothetical protein
MNVSKTLVFLEPITRVLNTRIPRLQRCVDEVHVNGMVVDQQKEYDLYKSFSMVQSITIGRLENQDYVLDGQHRIAAFTQLQQLGYPVHEAVVPVVMYSAASKEELSEYYNRINKHMPIHPFETEKAWEDCGKQFCELFIHHFGAYVKPADRCNCPHVSSNSLKTHFHARQVDRRLSDMKKTIEDMWDVVIKLNTYMKDKVSDQMCPRMQKLLNMCIMKSVKSKCAPCFLGAWRRFEWLDIVLYHMEHPGTQFNLATFSQQGSSRPKIVARVREQVWKKHNANTCDGGECFVCMNPLQYSDMECGHVIAHALGGTTSIDNLMPVCKTCNRDMGIMNLMDYKRMMNSMMGGMDVD